VWNSRTALGKNGLSWPFREDFREKSLLLAEANTTSFGVSLLFPCLGTTSSDMADFKSLTVAELKQECTDRGLPVSVRRVAQNLVTVAKNQNSKLTPYSLAFVPDLGC
jgi:hypothetical protein